MSYLIKIIHFNKLFATDSFRTKDFWMKNLLHRKAGADSLAPVRTYYEQLILLKGKHEASSLHDLQKKQFQITIHFTNIFMAAKIFAIVLNGKTLLYSGLSWKL